MLRITKLFYLFTLIAVLFMAIAAAQDEHEGHEDHDTSTSGTDDTTTTTDDEVDHSEHTSSSGGHSMYFLTGRSTILLFEGFSTSTWGEYIGALIFTMALGFMVEGWTTFRTLYPNHSSQMFGFSDATTLQTKKCAKTEDTIQLRVIKALFYAVGVTLAYALMLVVMSFNVGIFISAIAGLSLGYFCFGPARSAAMLSQGAECDSADCCHNVA